jgi:NAD(P)-dependent dehydrogenase (short-subunit alcohol dehydrogenase family)
VSRRVAFVTGASRGIGRATSLSLAEAGFDLVLTARSVHGGEVHEYSPDARRSLKRAMPGSLEETAAAVRERGREALVIGMDLLERASVERAVAQALATWGEVHVLVNNAIYQGPGIMDPALSLDLALLERTFLGNVVHQLALIQSLLPPMLERGRGTIINMVSAAGAADPPAAGDEGGWGFAYGASKAAFIRLVGILQVEHKGSGVAFHNVEPGLILTESMKVQGLTEDLVRNFGGAPPEVPAAVMAWLATDPGAKAWRGRLVHAQDLCRDLGLLPGWPAGR